MFHSEFPVVKNVKLLYNNIIITRRCSKIYINMLCNYGQMLYSRWFCEKSDNYKALSNICVSSGRRFSKDSFEIEPAMRETYVIILVTAGKGIFIIDGVKYPVKRGNSVMLFPFTSVKIVAYPNNIFEYKWVEITGFEIAVMISRTNFSKNRPIAPELPVDNFLQYFDVSDSSSETAYSICRTNGKVLILLSYYLQYYPSRKSTETNYVMQARDYIDRKFRETDCTVKSVAEKIQIDRTYLYRLFKEETGTSVIGYINQCRIRRACTMLSSTTAQVKDVALSVGFSDQLYFSKVFKKSTALPLQNTVKSI